MLQYSGQVDWVLDLIKQVEVRTNMILIGTNKHFPFDKQNGKAARKENVGKMPSQVILFFVYLFVIQLKCQYNETILSYVAICSISTRI